MCQWVSRCFYSLTSKRGSLTEMELKQNVPQVLGPMTHGLPPYHPGAPLDPTFYLQCITANIICSIVFGERFDYTDHQFLHLLDLFYEILSLVSSFSSQVSALGKEECLG